MIVLWSVLFYVTEGLIINDESMYLKPRYESKMLSDDMNSSHLFQMETVIQGGSQWQDCTQWEDGSGGQDGSWCLGGSDTKGHWGVWGPTETCPTGMYVVGAKEKIQAKRGGSDDSALNEIVFFCDWHSHEIRSSYGPWGAWGGNAMCKHSHDFVIGFKIRIESRQAGDDTSANGVRLYCQSDTELIPGDGHWGSWSHIYKCREGEAVAGIQTRVEPRHPHDDTSVNGLNVICRPLLKCHDVNIVNLKETRRNENVTVSLATKGSLNNCLGNVAMFRMINITAKEVSTRRESFKVSKTFSSTFSTSMEATVGVKTTAGFSVGVEASAEASVVLKTGFGYSRSQSTTNEEAFEIVKEKGLTPLHSVSIGALPHHEVRWEGTFRSGEVNIDWEGTGYCLDSEGYALEGRKVEGSYRRTVTSDLDVKITKDVLC